jgi:predicted membrane protein
MDIFQIIGFIGMLFVVYAYFLLQTHKVTTVTLRFQLLNLIGAILLIISLLVHFNLGSFLIEIFWITITLYGMWKNRKKN